MTDLGDTLAAMMAGGNGSDRGLLVSGRFPELEDALAERVLELRQGRPLTPLSIVVGSAAVRTRVGDLLVRALKAVANVDIVTLTRLAGDLVAEARGAPPAVLAGLARERFLRRLIEDHKNRLEYFGPVVDRPHFAAALAATFADLREGCVAPDSRWAEAVASAAGASPGAGRKKAVDLDRLYRAYCGELDKRKLLDGAAVQLVAAGAVSAGGAPAKTILYGIYDLNEAQKSLIEALIAGGADVFVPVPRHGLAAGASVRDAALGAGLVERRLEAPAESADRDRVAAVWHDRRQSAGEPLRLAGDGSLRVISVSDERAEAREAVRAVIAAVAADGAQGGATLCDCAIVVPHGDEVERMAAVLAAAGLPVACRLPDRSVGPRLLLRLADCFAPPAGKPFARRAVIDLLAAAPLRHNATEPAGMALWLDEARRAGIVAGLEQWTDCVGRRRSGLNMRLAELEEHPADAAGDDEDEAVEKLETLRTRLAAASGLYEAAGALESACRGLLSLRARWSVWAEKLESVVDALFKSPASDAARDAVGRLRALAVVDEDVEVNEVAGALRQLLEGGREPKGRVGRDGVAVLTPLELRGLRFHTVVFTGLAEGGFPTRGRPDPILGDADRGRIDDGRDRTAGGPGVRLPVVKDRAVEALLLFALACEAARENLVLIAPRSDAETGRPRLPARLLMALASHGAGEPIGQDDFLKGKGLTPVWKSVSGAPPYGEDNCVWVDARERDTQALLHLSARGGTDAARDYLSEVLADRRETDPRTADGNAADEGDADRRLDAWGAARSAKPGAWDGLLVGEALAALAKLPAARRPLAGELSPTRLERYIGCPFAFFLRDVLGLEAPEEPGDSLEIDNLEFGTLAHKILQQTYGRVIDDGLTRNDALAAVAAAWETCCAEAERRGITGAKLSWDVRSTMLREDLIETVKRDPVFAGDGRPAHVEWDFGEEHLRPVTIALGDGRQARFRGRIDRFDVTPSGARVIDYKTGAGNTEKQRIKDGLSVQLPVYQLAVREAAGEAAGEGFAEIRSLYRLVTRRGGFEDLALRAEEEAAGARLRDLVAGAIDLVGAGMFPRTTAGNCDYCDVRYACGVSDWARARKREHEGLADIVRLQRPAPKEDDGGV